MRLVDYQYLDTIISRNTILFFDLDGTLVDTDYANFLSYKKAIQIVKGVDIKMLFSERKRFNRSLLKEELPSLTDEEFYMIIHEKEKCYKMFLPYTHINNDIVGILYKYSKTNKTVLVTNSSERRALETLDYYGITDVFSNLFFNILGDTGEYINKYLNAIQALGISPNLVIVFENEDTEITDAKKAGIQIINPLILKI